MTEAANTPATPRGAPPVKRRRLGEILVESGIISPDLLHRALEAQKENRKRLGEVLVELQFVTEEDLARVLALQLSIPLADFKTIAIQPEAAELIEEQVAEKFLVLPFSREGRVLNVAMADPLDYETIEQIQFRTKLHVQPHIATMSEIQAAIRRHYSFEDGIQDPSMFDEMVRDISDDRSLEVIAEDMGAGKDLITELKQKSEAAPIIKMVNMLLLDAIKAGASDIHIDPRERSVQVRQRVDGVLFDSRELPKWMQGPIVSRVKIMSALDIAERRVPQDGNIKIRAGDREIDLRVSTLPTQYGEKAVLRLLDPAKAQIGLDEMGFPPQLLERYIRVIESPQGVVLITGPTGSGKTTTLYASLHHINEPTINIVTLEDPIEYNLAGINQVSLNARAGLTFSTGLRSILRQDPDVILVGEMRDEETADIAMKAAITGHLVFSTLHTNNSINAITRLLNMGVPAHLVASSLTCVMAQRLARILCDRCKVPTEPDPSAIARLNITERAAREIQFFRPVGCDACNRQGYRGRIAIPEMLVVTPGVRELIAKQAPEAEIRRVAREEGLILMAENGIERIREGQTTVDEVLRAVVVEVTDYQICEGCGATLHLDFISCPYCAHHACEICPSCETHVEPNWIVCPHCRADLAKPNKAAQKAA